MSVPVSWLRVEQCVERLKQLGTQEYVGQTLVDAGDWITKGAMTPVKNQRKCGSYWAFSVTDSFEDARLIAAGNMLPLFEQQLADCDTVDSVEKTAMCTRPVTITPQQKALAGLQVATWDRPGKCHGIQESISCLRVLNRDTARFVAVESQIARAVVAQVLAALSLEGSGRGRCRRCDTRTLLSSTVQAYLFS